MVPVEYKDEWPGDPKPSEDMCAAAVYDKVSNHHRQCRGKPLPNMRWCRFHAEKDLAACESRREQLVDEAEVALTELVKSHFADILTNERCDFELEFIGPPTGFVLNLYSGDHEADVFAFNPADLRAFEEATMCQCVNISAFAELSGLQFFLGFSLQFRRAT